MKKAPSSLFYFLLITASLSANIDIINLENIATDGDDFTIWSALFGLGIVSLIALFLSSEQLTNFKKYIYEKQEKRDKTEQTQNQILSSMSENIQAIAQETTATAKKLATENERGNIEQDLERVLNSEHQLLALTTNLIEFLKIKSKKVELVNESLKLSNLLNDITGTLKANTKDIELELMYDVKDNIPEYIIGDTLNLSKVLNNILLYFVKNSAQEIKITLSKDLAFSKKENLYFTIQSNAKIDVDNAQEIFTSKYNEQTDSYDSLELFVASELSNLMQGELVAKNDKKNHLEFVLKIPFKEEKRPKEKKTVITMKKVLIADSLSSSSSVIKDIFTSLKHKAKTLTKQTLLSNIPDFSKYDIVVLDEKLFTDDIVEALKKANPKIISISSLFKTEQKFQNSEIADIELNKPLTKPELEKIIEKLYSSQEIEKPKPINTPKKELLVHKTIFENSENVDLNKFADFNGIKILLVEDNTINQKVFAGVLNKTDIEITNANNGQEALEILRTNQEFDIIFMDINMPVMDGYSATTKIRVKQKFNSLPIIALSALTSASELNQMFECGMNGYLSKPLRKEKLYTAFKLFVTQKTDSQAFLSEDDKTLEEKNSENITKSILQKEILSEFRNIYGESAQKFKKLVEEENFVEVKVLALDIRNLSSSIGAKDMNALMSEILQKLSLQKHNTIYTYIEKYTKELNRLNAAIDKHLNK